MNRVHTMSVTPRSPAMNWLPPVPNYRGDLRAALEAARPTERLQKLAAATEDDLGADEYGPGVRPLGKVASPQPLIGFDGKIREGFAVP